ncbi:MAG: hypothetical protein HUJ26_04565 [Planctomycetaceae bacterium]|nr:hypothetical protein [Planctomycetaceae bacterium]
MHDSLRPIQTILETTDTVTRCRGNQLCQASAPDARWQQARHIWKTGTRLNWEAHGPQVVRAIRYLHAAQSPDPSPLQELSQTDPTMLETMKLHRSEPLRHLQLQCRILACQSPAEIAYELDTEPTAVTCYEDLFFDVRDELDQESDHLMLHVIGMSLTGPSPIEAYARLTAYRNGPTTIPAWLDYLPHRLEHHDLTTESGRQRESMAQFLTAESLLRTPDPDHSAIPYLDEIQTHFSSSPIPRSVATIVRDHTQALLREQPPEIEEFSDVVPFPAPTPELQVPQTA